MKTHPKFAFVVEYVADLATARRFYTEVLGLKAEREHPTFIQFGSFAIAKQEPGTSAHAPELYWSVDHLDSAFTEIGKHAEVVEAPKDAVFGRMFVVKDPDGERRFIVEFAKQRPSKKV